ncbi:transcriptional repressor LexA [Candidatus Saccharibacteria bacterium TM7i]|nr:transcriptional repressor LexA [Candidatus Saccharibacteria bacterium TM7i]
MSKGTTKGRIVDFIADYILQNGRSPTLMEIKSGVGLKSVSTIHQHVQDLLRSGVLRHDEQNGYQLASKEVSITTVPILGTITAGKPIEVIELPEDTIEVAGLPKNARFYALKVLGDSMIEEGIFDGDTVVIKEQTSAQNGQTVVAIIDENKVTLKKIYKEGDRFKLQPANQSLLPLYRDEVEVRGIVWSVHRNFKTKAEGVMMNTKEWKTVDLFAGVGGVRLGFEEAGFTTVFANDFEPKCKFTYDSNFNNAKLIVEDITKIQTSDIPDTDFVLGGFPCQAFSIAGYRQGFKDDKGRGNLFFDVARIIEDKQPTGFLLENVKNLKTHDGGNTYKVIEKTLQDLGYHVKSKVLNSMEYGNVPQNRERIYIVGFKDQSKAEMFEFPEPTPLTKKITDILEDEVDEKYYYNGKPLFELLKDEVNEVGQVYQWRRKYVRKNKKGVSPTLTANMGMGGHNVPIIYDGKGIRKLTPRECFRIQGFPDDYKLPDIADSALYKQAGNSVSVPVLKRIAEEIVKVL